MLTFTVHIPADLSFLRSATFCQCNNSYTIHQQKSCLLSRGSEECQCLGRMTPAIATYSTELCCHGFHEGRLTSSSTSSGWYSLEHTTWSPPCSMAIRSLDTGEVCVACSQFQSSRTHYMQPTHSYDVTLSCRTIIVIIYTASE